MIRDIGKSIFDSAAAHRSRLPSTVAGWDLAMHIKARKTLYAAGVMHMVADLISGKPATKRPTWVYRLERESHGGYLLTGWTHSTNKTVEFKTSDEFPAWLTPIVDLSKISFGARAPTNANGFILWFETNEKNHLIRFNTFEDDPNDL